MTFPSGARHDIGIVSEATFGVTPTSPAPTVNDIRATGTTLNLQKNVLTSEELRSDREVADVRHGNRRVTGDINFELSYATFDDLLEAVLFGSWTGDVLEGGTSLKSFSIERRFEDVSQFLVYKGCVMDALTLSIQPDQIVTGAFSVLGKDMAVNQSELATPSAAPSNRPFDSFTGSLDEGGSSIAIVTGLDLNLQNNLEPTFVIGDKTTPQIVPGRRNVSGTINAYFEDETLLEKFLDETDSSLTLTLTDPDGNDLEIKLFSILYTGADVPVQGGGPISLSMPFQARFSSGDSKAIQITRTAA